MKIKIGIFCFSFFISQIITVGAAPSWTEDFSSLMLDNWDDGDGNYTVTDGILTLMEEDSSIWHINRCFWYV